LKKQRSKIINQTNIEGWNWEKNQKKNNEKQKKKLKELGLNLT
jgi:hypothetical protein